MNISDFKANFKGGARPNLYKVLIYFPLVANAGVAALKLPFLCRSATLPASSLGTIPMPYLGRNFNVPGDRTFADWTITIVNDVDFALRDAFERWSNGINSHEGNISSVDLADQLANGDVQQLGKDGSVLKVYHMRDIWPVEISDIGLDFSNNDQVEEFTVTLAVTDWTSDTTT